MYDRYTATITTSGPPPDSVMSARFENSVAAGLGKHYALTVNAVPDDNERFQVHLHLSDGAPLTIDMHRTTGMPLSAWLPVTHGAYWNNFKSKVVNLGPNFQDAKIGLIVPENVDVNSLTDLEAKKTEFDSRIVGIDAGAGVMQKTSEAIKAYNLDYKLLPSSGSAMTAELARSEAANKPIIVTGWKPHWMFAKYKLKFLEDPKKVFGESEHVDNVINPELEKKAPQVVAFLKKFQWKPGEIDSVMLATQNGEKPQAAADAWISAHGDRVDSWTK